MNELDSLLGTLHGAQQRLANQHKRYVPVVLKIASDLDDDQIVDVVDALLRYKMDGATATSMTISREAAVGLAYAEEAGGLSGQSMREGSTRMIRALHGLLGDAVFIVGVGGTLASEHAREKIDAGTQLVQLYTGLTYRGPVLIVKCARALARQSKCGRRAAPSGGAGR